jgi:hypothetical protein
LTANMLLHLGAKTESLGIKRRLEMRIIVGKVILGLCIALVFCLSGCGGGKGGGADSGDSVILTDANTAPVANAGVDQSVITGTAVTLDGSASSEVDGDLLTYSWTITSKPNGSGASLSRTSVVNPTFIPDAAGTYVFSLVANDGKATSTADVVTVTASNVNAAPIANAGNTQNVVTGAPVTLDGSGSRDANGDLLSYSWTVASRPAGSVATLSSTTDAKPIFTPDEAGAYIFNLVVNDGKLNSAPATVSVIATAAASNAAPVARAGSAQSVVVGTVVTLDGSNSSDANGDLLTYNWTVTSKPNGSAAELSSAADPKPTFIPDIAGTYVFILVVNDGKVNSAAATVAVTATTTAANAAPVAKAGMDQSAVVGNVVTLDGSASSDADGDQLTYRWTAAANPGNAILSSTVAVKPTFTPDVVGTYVFHLVVNDGKINSVTSTVSIRSTTNKGSILISW